MSQEKVIHNTFVIERHYPCSSERVLDAFADPGKKKRWFAEGSPGHDIEGFEMDFSVGGVERLKYRFNEKSPFPGVPLTADGMNVDIVPGRRIVTTSTMAIGGKRISSALVTAEISAAEGGAQLVLFYEGADGPDMRKGGWQELLTRLEKFLKS